MTRSNVRLHRLIDRFWLDESRNKGEIDDWLQRRNFRDKKPNIPGKKTSKIIARVIVCFLFTSTSKNAFKLNMKKSFLFSQILIDWFLNLNKFYFPWKNKSKSISISYLSTFACKSLQKNTNLQSKSSNQEKNQADRSLTVDWELDKPTDLFVY